MLSKTFLANDCEIIEKDGDKIKKINFKVQPNVIKYMMIKRMDTLENGEGENRFI